VPSRNTDRASHFLTGEVARLIFRLLSERDEWERRALRTGARAAILESRLNQAQAELARQRVLADYRVSQHDYSND
jgi:hypothetical protein